MKLRKVIGALAKYIPFVSLLFIYTMSLYRGATTITDEMERGILIWTDALMLSVIIGGICNLLVMDRFSQLVTGKTPNIVNDFVEQDSKEFSVSYNGLIVGAFLKTGLVILVILYVITEIRLFLICCTILAVIFVLGTAINIFAAYLQAKREAENTVLSKLLDPVVLPTVISMILVLLTSQKTIGFVHQNLYAPQNTVFLILTLIAILCYVLAIAFCHFSNIYCLIAFMFEKDNSKRIQTKIDVVQEKNAKREDALRQVTEYVDEKAEQVGFFKKCVLAFGFFYAHTKVYFQGRYYAMSYLLSFVSLRLTKRLSGLLEAERIKNNGIRFCEVSAVLELLLLDMLLFIYLGSEDPCSRFFELLSTVIIIPILLSSLANLETNKHKNE